MKLAYFSPMPPSRTGIAAYSRRLIEAMRGLCDITVFTPTPDPAPIAGVEILDFRTNPHLLHRAAACDQVLYHIGNNPWYHLDIWRAMTMRPGPVCLHDIVLYYLVAGLGRGALLKELLREHGREGFRRLDAIVADCPERNLLRYPTPSRHPCTWAVIEQAPHLIVHNQTSARALKELGYDGRIDVLPLLNYAAELPPATPQEIAGIRRHVGFGASDFVLGAFGFIGPTKRLDRVLEALARLRDMGGALKPRLLVVGEGDSLDGTISSLGLDAIVTRLGFVAEEQFGSYLRAVDAVVNLRYPTHGESSGSLIEAMSYGKACIVTNDAFFAELPDGTVAKIPHGDGEVEALAEAMRSLISDRTAVDRIGEAARRHIAQVHAPETVAHRLVSLLADGARAQPLREEGPGFDPQAYFTERAASLSRL